MVASCEYQFEEYSYETSITEVEHKMYSLKELCTVISIELFVAYA